MKGSYMTRLLQVVLVGVCTAAVYAEGVDSKRRVTSRVSDTSVTEVVAQGAEAVRVERMPSDRAIMEGEVLQAITFWDDVSRYDLVLDPDGAILLDVEAQTVSDSFAFEVGPVPTIKNPDEVEVASLRSMSRRHGDSGAFDMDIGSLTVDTAMDALGRSEAASVFVNSGTAVVFFYVNGEVAEVLLFASEDQDGGGGVADDEDDIQNEHDKVLICSIVRFACVNLRDIEACGIWLKYCDKTVTVTP